MSRERHVPRGDPCGKCARPLLAHVVAHRPDAPLCSCGLPAEQHWTEERRRRHTEENKKQRAAGYRAPKTKKPPGLYVGIDGEGYGREDHRYVFLGAASAGGEKNWQIECENGLSTEYALDFLFTLPKGAKLFAFSFNYDLTMILRDLQNSLLYKLFRPELRQPKPESKRHGPYPVKWGERFKLNLMGTKFTVERWDFDKKRWERRVIWDLFRFYQTKFTNALADWKIAPKEEIEEMKRMKDNRGNFDRFYESSEGRKKVWDYCLGECRRIAELAQALVSAHEKVGLKLSGFYGAGSSASAMLKVMGIKKRIVPAPEGMRVDLARAFFGGRFENSVIGAVREEVRNLDISSAYPYQLMFLPCLEHGQWELTRSRKKLEHAEAALVRYRLHESDETPKALAKSWAPFPFRTPDGSICFPKKSPGGCVWREEYLAGERLFPGAEFLSAWVKEKTCDCQPFERIADYYRERVRIGKEGPGIVLKLGTNSCYGKLAQSVGNAPFNSWIWAGMITSGCRAQILELLALHNDPRNMLMVATDGVFTLEALDPPVPKDTGTAETGKPLGGWEEKIHGRGLFLARPGIYFPIDPTEEEVKAVRGRGIGKSVVLNFWKRIVDAYEAHGTSRTVQIAKVVRFCGAKSSITKSGPEKFPIFRRADGTKSSVKYGQWIEREVEMSFSPMPKRERVARDKRSLVLRGISDDAPASWPYTKALVSQEAAAMRAHQDELDEQPEHDASEYE